MVVTSNIGHLLGAEVGGCLLFMKRCGNAHYNFSRVLECYTRVLYVFIET